jgi:hypothetical protein
VTLDEKVVRLVITTYAVKSKHSQTFKVFDQK